MSYTKPHGSLVIPVKLTYKGGVYDEHVSELYDGIASLNGFSKMLHIVTHAYINEEVIYKATALKGARIYRQPSKRGSFVDVINVVMEHPIETMSMKLVYDGFYDFLKYTGQKVVGQLAEAKTRRVKQITRKEPFISNLCDSLKSPIKEAHRPIQTNSSVTIEVGKTRTTLYKYNEESLSHLKREILLEMEHDLECNVTKMNTLSPFGRLYLDQLGRTVPFEIVEDDVSYAEGLLLSKSLDDSKNRREEKIRIDAKKLVDIDGQIIKLFIHAVR